MRTRIIRYTLRLILASTLYLFSYSSIAIEGRSEFGVIISETHTDNITLTNDAEKQSELITQISPYLNLIRHRENLDFELNYTLQSLYYSDNPDRDQVFHQLNGLLHSEIIENLFFFSGLATYAQVIVDPNAPVALSNMTISDNRSDVATISANPYLQHGFNDSYMVTLGATGSIIDYREDEINGVILDDIERKQGEFRLEKLPGQSDFRWILGYSSEVERQREVDILSYDIAQLDLYYRLGARTEIFAIAGMETNLFNDSNITGNEDRQSFWETGFSRNSKISSLEVAVGERGYGRTYRMNWQYKAKILQMTLEHEESFQSFAKLQSSNPESNVGLFAAEFSPIRSIRTDLFLQKKSYAGIAFESQKTLLGFYYSKTERDFFRLVDKEFETSVGAKLTYNATHRSTYQAGIQRTRFIPLNGADMSDFYSASISYLYAISNNLKIQLELTTQGRDTENLSTEYTENREYIGVNYIF